MCVRLAASGVGLADWRPRSVSAGAPSFLLRVRNADEIVDVSTEQLEVAVRANTRYNNLILLDARRPPGPVWLDVDADL